MKRKGVKAAWVLQPTSEPSAVKDGSRSSSSSSSSSSRSRNSSSSSSSSSQIQHNIFMSKANDLSISLCFNTNGPRYDFSGKSKYPVFTCPFTGAWDPPDILSLR